MTKKKKRPWREMMFKMGRNLEFLHWSTGEKDISSGRKTTEGFIVP